MTAQTIATAEALLDDVARTEMALNPQMASRLGLDMEYARDARRKLNGVSQAAFERERLLRLDLQARLSTRPDMPSDHPLSRDLLITVEALQRLIDLQKSGYGRISFSAVRPYTIDPFSGLWIEGPETLIQDHIIETPQDAKDYLFRLSVLADGLQDIRRRLLVDARTGHLPPAILLSETRIRIDALLVDDNLDAIVETLSDFTAALTFDTSETRENLILATRETLAQDVRIAYKQLSETLAELEMQAPIPAGLWVQPGGITLYTDLTATKAAPGLRMEGMWKDIQNDLNTLKQAIPPTQAEQIEGPIGELASIPEDIPTPVIPELVGIVRTYVLTSRSSVSGLHFRPARLDNKRPALTELDAEKLALWPPYFQAILTDQNRLEAELTYGRALKAAATRSPVRGVIQKEGFHEGWLVYRQKQALAAPDQYLHFITTLAAADMGLHHQRWSFDETTSFISVQTGLEPILSRELALRIAANPAAALSTYIHYTRFASLANRAGQILDDDFDQGAFNQVLLKDGPRPLALVERDTENWYQSLLDEKN